MNLPKKLSPITLLFFGTLACSSQKPYASRNMELSRLFSEATNVTILSYVNRMYEAPLPEGDAANTRVKDTVLFVAGELNVLASTIREKLVLTRTQTESLFTILNTDLCKFDGGAICFNPRHAIIFYDSKNSTLGYIELCFDCVTYETSPAFEIDFCYEKAQALKEHFETFGLTYFSE